MHHDTNGADQPRRKRRRRRVPVVEVTGKDRVKIDPVPKRRRRRRVQPSSLDSGSPRSSTAKQWLCFVGIFGGFLVALYISYSVAYHNSASFQKSWESDMAHAIEAEVRISKLDIGLSNAKAKSLTLEWSQSGNSVKSLALSELRSDYFIGSLLGLQWRPKTVAAKKGEVLLDSEKFMKGEVLGALGTGAYLTCDDFEVNLTGSEHSFLSSSKAQFFNESSDKKVLLKGGVLSGGFFSEMRLQQGFLRFLGATTQVSARLESEGKSEAIGIQGDIRRGEEAFLSISMESVSLVRLLKDVQLSKVVTGFVSGKEGSLRITSDSDFVLSQKVEVTDVQLHGFDCFAVLAEVLGKQSYTRPRFIEAGKMQIKLAGNACELEGIDLYEPNFLKVRGLLNLNAKDQITGTLRIGIPQKHASKLTRAFGDQAFGKESGGYLWQSVDVGFEEGQLADNLRSMLLSSVRSERVDEFDADRLFDELLKE